MKILSNKLSEQLYTTEISAIDPLDGQLKRWVGPRIDASSFEEADKRLQTDGYGYCTITGEFVEEIEISDDLFATIYNMKTLSEKLNEAKTFQKISEIKSYIETLSDIQIINHIVSKSPNEVNDYLLIKPKASKTNTEYLIKLRLSRGVSFEVMNEKTDFSEYFDSIATLNKAIDKIKRIN